MILYAAYTEGVLIDQVAAESEDTALAKLRLDYPTLKGEITFVIIDPHHEEVTTTSKSTATAMVEEPKRPFKVIEAEKVEITLNVAEGSISKEDIDELQKAAEEGLVIAKAKES